MYAVVVGDQYIRNAIGHLFGTASFWQPHTCGATISFRRTYDRIIWRGLYAKRSKRKKWSGRLDLNQRPHAPQACALPGCATSRQTNNIQRITRVREGSRQRGVLRANREEIYVVHARQVRGEHARLALSREFLDSTAPALPPLSPLCRSARCLRAPAIVKPSS